MDEFFLLGNNLNSYSLSKWSFFFAVVDVPAFEMSLFLLAYTKEEIILLTFIESLFFVEFSLAGFLP